MIYLIIHLIHVFIFFKPAKEAVNIDMCKMSFKALTHFGLGTPQNYQNLWMKMQALHYMSLVTVRIAIAIAQCVICSLPFKII